MFAFTQSTLHKFNYFILLSIIYYQYILMLFNSNIILYQYKTKFKLF